MSENHNYVFLHLTHCVFLSYHFKAVSMLERVGELYCAKLILREDDLNRIPEGAGTFFMIDKEGNQYILNESYPSIKDMVTLPLEPKELNYYEIEKFSIDFPGFRRSEDDKLFMIYFLALVPECDDPDGNFKAGEILRFKDKRTIWKKLTTATKKLLNIS